MTDPRRRLPAVGDVRSFHLIGCPARDVAERRITAVCTCPPERFLDPWAEPIPEVAEDRYRRDALALSGTPHFPNPRRTGQEAPPPAP